MTTHSKPRSVCSGYSAILYSIYFLFIGNTSFPFYSFGRKIEVVWENASDFIQKYKYYTYLCKVLLDKLLKKIRKCLILVEIAKLSKKYIRGTEDSSYLVGCPTVRICRCLAIPNEYVQGGAHFL